MIKKTMSYETKYKCNKKNIEEGNEPIIIILIVI